MFDPKDDLSETYCTKVPDSILEKAISWAVRMHSQTASTKDIEALADWRAKDPIHEIAWQRIQSVDRQFGGVPEGASRVACMTLEKVYEQRCVSRRQMIKLAGLAVLAAGTVGTGLLMSRQPWRQQTTVATVAGLRRSLDLDDGSHLVLSSATSVEIVYLPFRRTVRLAQGDVYIETGHDAASLFGRREFWVESAAVKLEALGTRFCVRRERQRVRLHVAEGAVAVRSGGGQATVHAGETVWIDPAIGRLRRIQCREFDPMAWVRGAIVAKRMSLVDFADELGRYYGVTITVSADATDLDVSGVFQLDGSNALTRNLNALASTLPVRIDQDRLLIAHE